MDALATYNIPISGLKNENYLFDFHVDSKFLKHFEDAPFKDADLQVILQFDKRPSMFVLDFEIKGSVKAECDRCLVAGDLNIQHQEQLVVKFSDTLKDEAEVVYIPEGSTVLNVAQYIYEYINLAIPIQQVLCEDGNKVVCNDKVLSYLNSESVELPKEATENPFWETLQQIKNKKS